MACQGCGGVMPPYQGRGQPRKFCTRCRPSRSGRSSPVQQPAALRVVADGESAGNPDSVKAAVIRELTDAGCRWSALGMSAVLLAQKLDESAYEPGTGAAVLARQLSETMGEALSDANVDTADDLDRLLADG